MTKRDYGRLLQGEPLLWRQPRRRLIPIALFWVVLAAVIVIGLILS